MDKNSWLEESIFHLVPCNRNKGLLSFPKHKNTTFLANIEFKTNSFKMTYSPANYCSPIYLIFCLWIFPILLFGQYQLKGSISDAATGAPLAFANVYLANTSIGVSSDQDGHFLLDGVPAGDQVLIFSYLGYQAFAKEVKVNEYSAKKNFTIQLQAAAFSLATVEVSAKSGKKRKRYLKKFTKAFLGETANAGACKITNPEVLQFVEQDGKIIASAQELIELENRALGYHLRFYLEHFEWSGKEVKYAGKPLFATLAANTEQEKAQWAKRRVKTYLGSSRHFFKALVKDKLEQEGFKIFLAQQKNEQEFHHIRATNAKAILKAAPSGSDQILTIPSFLQVVYVHKKLGVASSTMGNNLKGLGQAAEKDMIQQSQNDVGPRSTFPSSYLFSRKSSLRVQANGQLPQAKYLLIYGYWAKEGVADLLPFEYLPRTKSPQNTTPASPQQKGFYLSNLRIPLQEIKDGGPVEDGIPAIDQATFSKAEEAHSLGEEEYILGVYHNGMAKAYPIKILDRHEVVNDQFGDAAVTVTFCPLCASGLAFEADKDQGKRSFGVSGLLYNSDVLLYDRETESLWSQIKGQAISGPESGSSLNFLPAEYTTWGAWKKRFPASLVLQAPKGFSYDYEQKAYARYLESSELIFPVAAHSRQLNNKDKIIGIEIDGQFKAYPLKELKRKESPIGDHFNGKDLVIFYDSVAKSARIEDQAGKVLNGMTMFWFAWYAFHPETILF